MLLTEDTKPLPKKRKKPACKWQKGHYASTQEFRFHFPPWQLMLCKILGVTPNECIGDFVDHLACSSWQREGNEEARKHLQQYVLLMGYGQQFYNKEDIEQMFRELDAVGLLWPKNAPEKTMECHAQWRDQYFEYWYKKWMGKYRRKM